MKDYLDVFSSYRSKELFVLAILNVITFVAVYLLFQKTGSTLGIVEEYSPLPLVAVRFAVWLIFTWFSLLCLGRLWPVWRKLIGFVKKRTYVFKIKDWESKWIFNGKSMVITNPPGLRIQASRAGCLLEGSSWEDFQMKFLLKFNKESRYSRHIGIIFHAQDLDNYFMLEVIGENPNVSIKPHVRFRGGWEIFPQKSFNEVDFSNFQKVVLTVVGRKATLRIGNIREDWVLPTEVDVNHLESGSGFPGVQEAEQEKKTLQLIPVKFEERRHVFKIPFLKFGMIGFRAANDQGAQIASLHIKSL